MCFKNLPIEFDAAGQRDAQARRRQSVLVHRDAGADADRGRPGADAGAVRAQRRACGASTSTRSPASPARSPSTPSSTSRTARCWRPPRWRRSSAATRSSSRAATRATRSSSPAAPAACAAACTRPPRRSPSRWRSASTRRRWASSRATCCCRSSTSTTTRSTCRCWPARTSPRPAVRETNPEIWERALQHEARAGAATHGYELMSDLMTDLTPLTGKLYLEGLYYTRLAREAYVLIGGKYPHPQTVVPGRRQHDDRRLGPQRDHAARRQVLRLRPQDRRDLGRPRRVLLRGQPEVPRHRHAPGEHDRARAVGRPLRLRRHVRERRRVGPRAETVSTPTASRMFQRPAITFSSRWV